MGDKTPKSKQRGQKQKDLAKTDSAAAAKSKQARYDHSSQPAVKGKK